MDDASVLLTSEYTYSYDKYSCSRAFYFLHVIFCYVVALTGIACMVVRLIPKLVWTHKWFGRVYISAMLMSTATSILIHNTGLPLVNLIQFGIILVGMVFAWFIILFHVEKMNAKALFNVSLNIKNGESPDDLKEKIDQEKARITAKKSFKEKFFSYRTLHAATMVTTWFQIIGRIFSSNQSGDFQCYTYPAYKNLNTPNGDFRNATEIILVEARDPDYAKLPWARTGEAAWILLLSLGPFLISLAVSAGTHYYNQRQASKRSSGGFYDLSADKLPGMGKETSEL